MAQTNKQRDLMTRLSDAGEDAISKLTSSQSAARLVESVGGLRERIEDVQKKLRGVDELEKQLADLKPKRSTSSRSRSSASTRRATPRKKPPPSSS